MYCNIERFVMTGCETSRRNSAGGCSLAQI